MHVPEGQVEFGVGFSLSSRHADPVCERFRLNGRSGVAENGDFQAFILYVRNQAQGRGVHLLHRLKPYGLPYPRIPGVVAALPVLAAGGTAVVGIIGRHHKVILSLFQIFSNIETEGVVTAFMRTRLFPVHEHNRFVVDGSEV